MLTILNRAAFLFALSAVLRSQDAGAALLERVQHGGDLVSLQWQRDADGALQYQPGADDPWSPMFRAGGAAAMASAGAIGYLALLFHGPYDLLAMTDGAQHLHRLGVDTSDIGLRQFLVTPLPAGASGKVLAEQLDRIVAIDLLVRRGVVHASVEFQALQDRADAPPWLRARAAEALSRFGKGGTPAQRQRFSVATLPLPPVADAFFVLRLHRLPEAGQLMPVGRRLGMTLTARVIQQSRGAVGQAVLLIAQELADSGGELPFEIVRRCGLVRLDDIAGAVLLQASDSAPLAAAVQGLGAWDARRIAGELHDMQVPVELADGRFTFAKDPVTLTTDDGRFDLSIGGMKGRPRPELAQELLADDTAALQVVCPANSKVWPALLALGLPGIRSGSVSLHSGDELRLAVELQARDEEAATELVSRLQQHVANLPDLLRAELPAFALDQPLAQQVLAAVAATKIVAIGSQVEATIVLQTPTGAEVSQFLEGAVLGEAEGRRRR